MNKTIRVYLSHSDFDGNQGPPIILVNEVRLSRDTLIELVKCIEENEQPSASIAIKDNS
jgi:hypothetical protein